MRDLTKFIDSSEQAERAFYYIKAMDYYYRGTMTLEEAEFYSDILLIFE